MKRCSLAIFYCSVTRRMKLSWLQTLHVSAATTSVRPSISIEFRRPLLLAHSAIRLPSSIPILPSPSS